MAKVLIIGSKGMLGQELVGVFEADKNYSVTGWDKEDIDITDFSGSEEKIFQLKPQIIINAAAYNAVDKAEESEGDFKLAKAINGEAPGNLAKIAKSIGAKFVHYSSDYVFDGRSPRNSAGCSGFCASCPMGGHKKELKFDGYKEDDLPNPISRYGFSKLLGEESVKKYGKNYYIIRLSRLFGKPAISSGAKKSFFDVMLEAGKKNKEVKVVKDEMSNFTYASDLAEATKKLVESKKPSGIYHITNSGAVSWYAAVKELYKMAGLKTKIIPVTADEFPRPARRAKNSTLINTKLKPLRNYKEALKEHLSQVAISR